jgi:hypothetical protein
MNKAFELIKNYGYCFIYIYSDLYDEFPEKVKTSDLDECSYYYQNSFDVRFSLD